MIELPEQDGWAVEMHGECVLFANNAEKASGRSPGATTPIYTAATVRRLIAEAVEKEREAWRTRQNMTLASPEMATHMERLKERIATEPGYALGLLVDAGICNEDGTLTEQFGGGAKEANDG